jgi:hypothetical protein
MSTPIFNCFQLPNENCLTDLHSPSSFTHQASSSCPADLARIKQLQGLNLTTDEIKMIVKDRQKKDNHNMSKSFFVAFRFASSGAFWLQHTLFTLKLDPLI